MANSSVNEGVRHPRSSTLSSFEKLKSPFCIAIVKLELAQTLKQIIDLRLVVQLRKQLHVFRRNLASQLLDLRVENPQLKIHVCDLV